MNKKQKRIGIILAIIVGIIIVLGMSGVKLPFATTGDLSVSTSFTPIFCNDYEFTCCNEKIDLQNQQIVLQKGETWTCPATDTRCEVRLISHTSATNWYYIDSSLFSDMSTHSMQPNQIIKNQQQIDLCILGCQKNTYQVNTYKLRLDFCGKSGCSVGVPVLGADGCHFNPEKAKIYTTANQLINAVSYTVPKDTCILSFQSGDRHICGYAEESCQSNSDCGGHTYGDKECNGRTLQTYGCRSFGTVVALEKDRLPSESGWGTDSSETIFGKRCEIISAQQVQCCGDTDCGVNYFCDRSTWTCKQNVQCSQDYDCGVSIQCDYTVKKLKKPICSLGQCTFQETPVDCCSDVNCPTGYYCTAERKCAKKIAVCLECPYECCENQCEVSGGYFDKLCPSDIPFCVDNACKITPPEEECASCWSWLKDKLGMETGCNRGLFGKIWDALSCPFYFLKLAIVLIASIMALFFGKQFSEKQFKRQPKWLYWVLGIIFAGLVGFLGYTFLEWYFVIPLIIIVVIGNMIINAIPGGSYIKRKFT